MAPRKRRILIKLLALRFIRGNRGKFDMDVALEQLRLDKLERERQEAELALLEALADEMEGTRFGFRAFSRAARTILAPGTSGKMGPVGSRKLLAQEGIATSTKHELVKSLLQRRDELDASIKAQEDAAAAAAAGASGVSHGASQEDAFDVDAPMQFGQIEMEEAAQMISRLRERTELALNKHHHAKKNLMQQLSQSVRESIEANASNISLLSAVAGMDDGEAGVDGGKQLRQISTMELIKETVDPEEQKDLEELYFLWDEAIQLYEVEEFPGDYEVLNKDAENWYTYRGLVAQRLEVVARTLYEMSAWEGEMGDGSLVIEEGSESGEDESRTDIEAGRAGVGAGLGAGAGGARSLKRSFKLPQQRHQIKGGLGATTPPGGSSRGDADDDDDGGSYGFGDSVGDVEEGGGSGGGGGAAAGSGSGSVSGTGKFKRSNTQEPVGTAVNHVGGDGGTGSGGSGVGDEDDDDETGGGGDTPARRRSLRAERGKAPLTIRTNIP